MSGCAQLIPNSAPLLKPAFLWMQFISEMLRGWRLGWGTRYCKCWSCGLGKGRQGGRHCSMNSLGRRISSNAKALIF